MEDYMDRLIEKVNSLDSGPMKRISMEDDFEEAPEEREAFTKDDYPDSEKDLKSAGDGLEGSADELFNKLSLSLHEMKKEILDQVHRENVRCYRNTEAALSEDRETRDSATNERFKGLKRRLHILIVLSIFELAAIAGLFLYIFLRIK